MSLFTPEAKGQILEILSGLVHPVRILFFKQAKDCLICPEQQRLLEELTKLSEKLSLRVYDVVFHGDQAMNYQINRVPATVIMGEEDYGIRFYGLTAGHEFSSLISTIMMISIGAEITPEYEEIIGSIEKPVHIKVMTTLTCPYCPTMVNAANLMAFLNPNIRTESFDVSEYHDLTKRYNVNSVPRTIINEHRILEGVVPLPQLILEILKTADPDAYRKLEDSINATPCDLVLMGTPTDLRRYINVEKPVLKVSYEFEEIEPGLIIAELEIILS